MAGLHRKDATTLRFSIGAMSRTEHFRERDIRVNNLRIIRPHPYPEFVHDGH